ncbi:PUB domain containing protein, putative [Angomonas deanei]|uniref:PUB domain containing protein, putative n=1 Tax=Angomonas deanei TaxID=59799 RepID=A0A7G2CA27_9TRYP|nr:PUB domain containing protein, putative [Angomonas deanei]
MLLSSPPMEDQNDATSLSFLLAGITQLIAILTRIVTTPQEAKYRGISRQSSTYVQKLKFLENVGGDAVFEVCGFVRREVKSSSNNNNEAVVTSQWYLSDEKVKISVLKEAIRVLEEVQGEVETAIALVESTVDTEKENNNTNNSSNNNLSAPCALLSFCKGPVFPAGGDTTLLWS